MKKNCWPPIEEARGLLRRDDELEASQAQLLALLAEFPDHPLVLFEVGGAYDVLGEEGEAIPYYRRAIAAGVGVCSSVWEPRCATPVNTMRPWPCWSRPSMSFPAK